MIHQRSLIATTDSFTRNMSDSGDQCHSKWPNPISESRRALSFLERASRSSSANELKESYAQWILALFDDHFETCLSWMWCQPRVIWRLSSSSASFGEVGYWPYRFHLLVRMKQLLALACYYSQPSCGQLERLYRYYGIRWSFCCNNALIATRPIFVAACWGREAASDYFVMDTKALDSTNRSPCARWNYL